MSAMREMPDYVARNGKIYRVIDTHERHYDVDWGWRYTGGYEYNEVCDDTPENRQKYHID